MPPELQDGLIASTDHPVRLPVFEGPLDLLLFLIRRDELDIYDIPIARVTEQYLSMLRKMERMNLEVAGDFFVMAATLMHLKSRVLIPKDRLPKQDTGEGEEEGPDPRWDLVQQLLDYRRFKEAAQAIEAMAVDEENRLPRTVPFSRSQPAEERPLRNIQGIELWEYFNDVLKRLSERISVGHIEADRVTVADEMSHLRQFGADRGEFSLEDYFAAGEASRVRVVAAFLACLELARTGLLVLEQDHARATLFLSLHEGPPLENVAE